MKYWWLEKYKNFRIIQTKELLNDINYFLVMPKNYLKQYQLLKSKNINNLLEEELVILLERIVTTKNINNNNLNIIIEKLLEIPDNSFPSCDYSLSEMLEEIKNLKYNLPEQNKLANNNIAVCYNCLNVFYVDKIKNVNKNNLCLCPYCLRSKLYFDNDYIPMNYTFIKLANIYYGISSLGCSFKEIKKIIRKNIKVSKLTNSNSDNLIDITELFFKKILPIDEKIISKRIYDLLLINNNELKHDISIYIDKIDDDSENKLLLSLVSVIHFLANNIYLKEVNFIFNDYRTRLKFKLLLKQLTI